MFMVHPLAEVRDVVQELRRSSARKETTLSLTARSIRHWRR